ncbi:MAG: hypothetical protein K2F81_09565 [Ruminococcus sp.]|nr:hypothetical protein [Ruminococcus sp.]
MAVIEERKRTYVSESGHSYTIVVRLKDDAYKDCSKEEIAKRKEQFLSVCSQLMPIALKRSAEQK